jgi:hypothetical protein
MTLWTVSNQGFTVHNHTCGINFLSHLRGAPQNSRQTGMAWDALGYAGRGEPIAEIAVIARNRRNRNIAEAGSATRPISILTPIWGHIAQTYANLGCIA